MEEVAKMLDIFSEIKKITDKYKINTQKFLKDQLENVMEEIFEKAAQKYGKRVIIRGIKTTEEKIHPLLAFVDKHLDIVGVQDPSLKDEFVYVSPNKKVPVIPLTDSLAECDIYLINARILGVTIRFEVEKKIDQNKTYLLDLYFVLKNDYGIWAGKDYELYNKEYDCTYKRIKDAIKEDKIHGSEESLLNLLGQCLCIGDFTSLYIFKESERRRIEESKKLESFIDEVELLIKTIKKEFRVREKILNGKKDIVWQWIDCVSYEELTTLSRVEKRIKEGIFFTEAYTPTPYTRPALRSIFWKEFRKMGSSAKGRYIPKDIENSNLFNLIREHGYEFEAFGYARKCLDVEYQYCENAELSTASCTWYLRTLNRILKSDKPCFCLAHIFLETHPPYTCPWENIKGGGTVFVNDYKDLEKKINISAQYADQIIDFYSDIMGKQSIGIYMSDHGKWGFIEKRRYKDECIHILLSIVNMGVKAEISRIFSLLNFDHLVEWIFKTNDVLKEEMIFGDVELYSEDVRGFAERKQGDTEDICAGFSGVNTAIDKYCILDNGKEYYLLKEDHEAINHIDNEKYSKRIEYLKDRLNDLMNEQKTSECINNK